MAQDWLNRCECLVSLIDLVAICTYKLKAVRGPIRLARGDTKHVLRVTIVRAEGPSVGASPMEI
jgi:hypothetical protein